MSKPPVVIIAGGQSSRFFPFNELTHKSGLSVLGKPLIVRTIENLQGHGFTQLVVVVSPKDADGQGLSQLLTSREFTTEHPDVQIELVTQLEAQGMGDAVLQAQAKVQALTGERGQFGVIHPYHFQAGEVLDQMLELNQPLVVASAHTDQPWNYGILDIQNDQAVGLVEKPPTGSEPSSQKILGIYLMNHDFLATLAQTPLSHYHFEEALNSLMKSTPIRVLNVPDNLLSLKYAWQLFDFMAHLLRAEKSFTDPSAEVADTAVIDDSQGPVIIKARARIGHAVKLIGPLYVGEDVLVGDFSFIRGSSLEKGVQVGANTEVARSLMMPGSTIHFGYLADSIVGVKTKIAAGLITANRRFDRAPVKVLVKDAKVDSGRSGLGALIGHEVNLGIRVGTMPGVCIGSQATVYPGTIVYENVPHQGTSKPITG